MRLTVSPVVNEDQFPILRTSGGSPWLYSQHLKPHHYFTIFEYGGDVSGARANLEGVIFDVFNEDFDDACFGLSLRIWFPQMLFKKYFYVQRSLNWKVRRE